MVLARGALATERELGFGDHARERRAQLVRDLGREALFVTEARREPVEQRVERGRELGHLVVRPAEREAIVEVALAPVRGLPRHARDRAERRLEQPARCESDDEQEHGAEGERAEQRRVLCLLVRRERDAGDDGAEPPAVDDDRRGVEACVGGRDVEAAGRPSRERLRGRSRGATGAGSLERPSPREDPDRAVERIGVRRLPDDKLPGDRPE